MTPGSESGRARTPAAKRARRQRLVGQAAAAAAHALVLALLLSGPPLTPRPAEPGPESPPMTVELVPPPRPPAPQPSPKPAPAPAPKKAAAAKPAPRKPLKIARASVPRRPTPKPQPSEVPPRVVPPEPAPPAPEVTVSDAELASATTAESEAAGGGGDGGEGAGGGGRCDMVSRLQRALRGDARVRAAVAGARRAPGFAGRPLVIWNGDWVRHGEEDGKGLASVRQAIAVEVAFAPKACRAQSMHGLVLLSLNEGSRPARLVLGAGSWRWSDLVYAR